MVSRGFPVLAGALALLAAGTAAAQQPATSAAGIDAATPTAADFGALPFLTQPLLSPDGKQLLAIGQFGGKKMVLVINVDDPKTGMVRFAAPDKNQIEWVRWAGSRRILASLSRADSLMGEDVRVTRLMMADLDTHKQTLVGPQEQGVEGDNIVHVDPAGKFLLLNTQPSIYDWPEVYRVDLDTGRSKRVVEAQEGVWNWYADRAGVVRVGIGIDGNRSWVTYRSDEKEPFKRVLKHDARNDTVSDDEDIYQFEPVPGSDGGYAMAFGKTGHFALYRYDFGALKRGELLYENPEVDIDDFSVASDGSLRAIYYTDDRSEIAWFDPEMKKLQGAIDRAVPGKINRIVSTSEDRNRMLIWSGSANDPGAYYLFDRASKHLGILATPYASLEGKRLSTVQPVRYKARDGLEIRAYLTLPPGKETAQGLPLVVMPHGGPFARDEGDYDDWVQFVASRGYVVLQPNFRGSTGFGKAFVDKGNGQWGRGM
ncbi:prolyl oligopeptidase family serine peptidase, partial [Sphingomonas sp.]|uniref:alpha/beta hydrolase family protein n=1 Tax=Sphingomonas sp. TaxID=28214 RepID=UPI001B169526